MKKLTAAMLLVLAAVALPSLAAEEGDAPAVDLLRVEIVTSKGTIELELYPDKAPKTVKNFLGYVTSGFYEGTVFHRVIPGFMVQGGGFGADLKLRPPAGQLQNEADNGLSNARGTIAMARQNPAHTATCQFFVNLVDNLGLDYRSKASDRSWGYAVFGKVTAGMDVVDAIAEVQTGRRPNGMSNVPVEPVLIEKATLLNVPDAAATDEPAATLD